MKKSIIAAGLALFLINNAHADTDINFKGVVHETPECTVNGGQPITVDFGTVDVDTIDNIENSVDINYSFECPALPSDLSKWFYYYQFRGTASSFDTSALATSISDLGIRLTADGVSISPGSGGGSISSLTPNGSSPLPQLKATLIKNSGSTLTTGDFSATASLEVTYY